MSPPLSFFLRDDKDGERQHKKPKKKTQKGQHDLKLTKVTLKDDDKDGDSVDKDDIPAPLPDTRKHHASHTKSATHSISKSRALSKSHSATISHASHIPSAMPTYNLAATQPSMTSVIIPHSSTLTTKPQGNSASSFQLSTLAIVLLAVGSAVLIIGLAIFIRACNRPKKRWYPTPSLPILQDDPFESDGSPLFGGKERLSRPGTIQWTQYTQPSYGSEKTAFTAVSDDKMLEYNDSYRDAHPVNLAKFDLTHPVPAPPQASHLAPTRVPVRMSTISASVYPGSPGSRRSLSDIGIAVTTPAPALTADGHPIIARARSKSITRRSRSNSIYSANLAYDGADVASPAFQTTFHSQPLPPMTMVTSASLQAGRTRTRSSYIQHSAYGRWPEDKASTNATAVEPSYQLFDPGPRERDTRALTTALGLQTPVLGSETPATIYPDDSLSIRAPPLVKKGHKKVLSKAGPTSRFSLSLGGGADTSLALGSLMMMDYGTNDKSSADLATNLAEAERNAGAAKQANNAYKKIPKTRDDDRPPRVPSPPQLPSLAQMAMEYENPEAYANYHSPTYSIYGMYDPNRKSKA